MSLYGPVLWSRLQPLVHLPFTTWTVLGLIAGGLAWLGSRQTSTPAGRERVLLALSLAMLGALITVPLAVAWVVHALAIFVVVEHCRPRWLAIALVALLLAIMVVLPVRYVGWLGERGVLARQFIAFASNMAVLRLWGHAADRWRGAVPAMPARRFLLGMVFFPTFVNGPVEVPRQLPDPWPAPSGASVYAGLTRISIGVAKLVLPALAFPGSWLERFAHAVIEADGLGLWIWAARLYVWFYLTFSAWSDVAIGLGALTGHRVLENFDYPWLAVDPADFWHRWHVSFGRWLRDYVYIPLGGSRRHRTVNVGATFAVSALWHVWGALKLLGLGYYPVRAWYGFLLWGAMHTVGVLVGPRLSRAPAAAGASGRAVARGATFLFACFCWIPFFLPAGVRLPQALHTLARMAWPFALR